MKQLPAFLQDVKVTKGEFARHKEVLSNWMKTHAAIKELKVNEKSLELLQQLMVVEYNREEGPRMDVIVRLHGRFQRLRHELERVKLGMS